MNEKRRMILRLTGRVEATDFAGWIERHAGKLGVDILSSDVETNLRRLEVRGPEELIQALELACSLGPQSVLVESTTLRPVVTKPRTLRSDRKPGEPA